MVGETRLASAAVKVAQNGKHQEMVAGDSCTGSVETSLRGSVTVGSALEKGLDSEEA